MKKIATWLAVVSAIVFIIAWGIGALMIYENNYESNAWACVGLVAIIIFIWSLIYLKITRCPRCGKMNEENKEKIDNKCRKWRDGLWRVLKLYIKSIKSYFLLW